MNKDNALFPAGPAPSLLQRGLRALAGLGFTPTTRLSEDAGTTTRSRAVDALVIDLDDPEQRDLGDFELREVIGKGGMGVVYRAWQKSLDREVAVKLLVDGPWAAPEFIERFRHEARSAARMQHPNIVSVHEFGSCNDLFYFSMPLIAGEDLGARLRREGAWSADDAARLLRTVAEAVDYAHGLGVLHLDLKPGNILLDAERRPLVADFGLARSLSPNDALDTEEISGTPAYMAPEQVELRRHRVSAATDVYALGAILYELLTGQPPVQAGNVQEALRQVLEDTPRPPRRLKRSIPADISAICLKCLAKDPAARYATARDVVEDLGRFLDGNAVLARSRPWLDQAVRLLRRRPRVVLAASFLIAGYFALIFVLGALKFALLQQDEMARLAASLMVEPALLDLSPGEELIVPLDLIKDHHRASFLRSPDWARMVVREIGDLVWQGPTGESLLWEKVAETLSLQGLGGASRFARVISGKSRVFAMLPPSQLSYVGGRETPELLRLAVWGEMNSDEFALVSENVTEQQLSTLIRRSSEDPVAANVSIALCAEANLPRIASRGQPSKFRDACLDLYAKALAELGIPSEASAGDKLAAIGAMSDGQFEKLFSPADLERQLFATLRNELSSAIERELGSAAAEELVSAANYIAYTAAKSDVLEVSALLSSHAKVFGQESVLKHCEAHVSAQGIEANHACERFILGAAEHGHLEAIRLLAKIVSETEFSRWQDRYQAGVANSVYVYPALIACCVSFSSDDRFVLDLEIFGRHAAEAALASREPEKVKLILETDEVRSFMLRPVPSLADRRTGQAGAMSAVP